MRVAHNLKPRGEVMASQIRSCSHGRRALVTGVVASGHENPVARECRISGFVLLRQRRTVELRRVHTQATCWGARVLEVAGWVQFYWGRRIVVLLAALRSETGKK